MDSPDNTQEAGLDCHPTETLVRSIDIDETIVQKIQCQNRLDFIHPSADWFQALDDFLHYFPRRRKSKNGVVCSVVDNRILGVLANAQSGGGVSTTRGRFAKIKKGEGVISPSILFRNVVLCHLRYVRPCCFSQRDDSTTSTGKSRCTTYQSHQCVCPSADTNLHGETVFL